MISHTIFVNNRKGRENEGFALLVALALMAFVLLLLLSLGTVLQLEIRAGTHAQAQWKAQQNAKLALAEALGQLQKYAGPDRRITARGDIRTSTSNNARFWTGVWQSAEHGLLANPIGDSEFLIWLVSASTADGRPRTFKDITEANHSDPLSGSWGRQLMVGGNDPVEAGLVVTGDSGAYAWWVGDEGVKAKVTITDPFRDAATGSDEWMNRMRTAQRFGAEFIHLDNLETISLRDIPDLTDQMSSALWPQDLLTLDSDLRELLQYRYHDITTHGYGLAVDVTKGRLRRDLTSAFENDAVFNDYFADADGEFFVKDPDFIDFLAGYLTANPRLSYNFSGPHWNILRSYYTLYRTHYQSGVATPLLDTYHAHADAFADRPYGSNYGGTVNRFDYHRNNLMYPVTARKQYSIGLRFMEIESSVEDNIRTTVYLPVIRVMPIMVIYNPYSVFMAYPGGGISSSVNPLIEMRVGDHEVVSFHLIEIMPPALGTNTALDYEDFRTTGLILRNNIPAMPMDPGESLIFSLPRSEYLVEDPFNGRDWERKTYSAAMINDTEISGAYELPVHANYVLRATVDGANARQAGGRLGAFPANFGLSANELGRLQFTVREVITTGEIVEVDNLEIKIRFSDPVNFPFLDDYHGVGGMTVQRFLREFGLGNGQMQSPSDATEIEFQDFRMAEDQPTLAGWRYGLRLIVDAFRPVRFIDINFRPVILNYLWETGLQGTLIPASLLASAYGEPKGILQGSDWEMPGYWDENRQRYQAYWGDSIDGSQPTTNVTLFDVPTRPLLSLGALQHANMGRYAFHPAYIIGQSYAPPLMPRDKVMHRYFYGSREGIALDLPYLLNQTLWDGYFFSSIPQDLDQADLDELLTGNDHLPNSRHKLYSKDGPLTPTDLRFDDTNEDNTQIFETVAANILIDGAFNINSTSIQAWRALLFATAGLELPVLSPIDGQLLWNSSDEGPLFARFSNTFGDENALFNGARRLTTKQVDELAKAIVAEVKARGPFGSLAAFINRSPFSSDEETLTDVGDPSESGVLQAAIDSIYSINEVAFTSSGDPPLPKYGPAPTPHGPQAAGLPGYLLQSDLLQVLGPILTARSDTFIIRAYGESHHPHTGEIVGRAWCEAVVQRMPVPVMTPDSLDETAELISPSNEMGRRFIVTAFRWLDPESI